jgi:hypothetical protein
MFDSRDGEAARNGRIHSYRLGAVEETDGTKSTRGLDHYPKHRKKKKAFEARIMGYRFNIRIQFGAKTSEVCLMV